MSNERAGALLAAAWAASVTASAEPARFRRGREYLRENAVVELVVLPGQLIGQVQGSRAEAYEVVCSVPTLESPGDSSVAQLVPNGREIRYRCTCPDWDDPCKHAVAVALAFGEQLRFAPDQLARLRGAAAGTVAETMPTAPSPQGPARRLSLVRSGPGEQDGPAPLDPAVVAFLGLELEIPQTLPVLEPLTLAAPMVGSVDVAAVVSDAVSWLSAAFPIR